MQYLDGFVEDGRCVVVLYKRVVGGDAGLPNARHDTVLHSNTHTHYCNNIIFHTAITLYSTLQSKFITL